MSRSGIGKKTVGGRAKIEQTGELMVLNLLGQFVCQFFGPQKQQLVPLKVTLRVEESTVGHFTFISGRGTEPPAEINRFYEFEKYNHPTGRPGRVPCTLITKFSGLRDSPSSIYAAFMRLIWSVLLIRCRSYEGFTAVGVFLPKFSWAPTVTVNSSRKNRSRKS